MEPHNPYADDQRAERYAGLGIENTYYLAYRDLPGLFTTYGIAGTALDYGCGNGRSTRFLRSCGFSAVGVDISAAMIRGARDQEPDQDFRVIEPARLAGFADGSFDLVLSVMPFDSIPTEAEKIATLTEIARVLKPGAWSVLVAATQDVYLREWVSFSAVAFPENRSARDGDVVRVVINELGDRQPVEDILWTERAYVGTFGRTALRLVDTVRPIASPDDDYRCAWVSERTHAPWVIFVLQKPL